MTSINLDRDKSRKLFYKFKDLECMLSMMSGVVQNPDFADTNDVVMFKSECERFEKIYEDAKNSVIELFKQ